MRVLAKKPGSVGSKASSVLNKWRDVVANSQKSSETSSLKENDHPKEISHNASSKTHHRSEKETKKYDNHSERKHFKDKHSNKVKHGKEKKHEDRHANPEHSKEKFKILPKEDKHHKEKHSTKRLSNEEHEFKKKHANDRDMKADLKSHTGYPEHSIIQNEESSSGKKYLHKNKLNFSSKREKTSPKHHSSFLQQNPDSEEDGCNSEYSDSFLNNECELPAFNDPESAKKRNSDSSASYEPSPKKSKTFVSDSNKHKSDFRTMKSSQSSTPNSSKERKTSSDLEKSHMKNISKDSESRSKIKISYNEEKHERSSDKSKAKKSAKKDLKMLSTEEFTSSEATFEDCLSFNDIVPLKKKKSSKPVSNSLPKKVKESSKSLENSRKMKKSRESPSSPIHPSPSSVPKEEEDWKMPEERTERFDSSEKRVDIASTLPQTLPNYRPLPQRNYDYSPIKKKGTLITNILPEMKKKPERPKENMSNEDAIKFTSSRKEKTAVYSGRKNKTNYLTAVPTLFECCTRVLIENIDDIEYMGVVPYFLLESMLKRCTPAQLYRIEDFNPYLLEDTNELWEVHCKRDYRTAKPQENETWRELYWRSHDEREQKLRSVTANISALIANSNPTRKAKLAYVDAVVKPPRDVARRQAKHGTALPTSHTVKTGPPSKASPRPTAPSINVAASTSRPRFEAKPMKPKVAPLMAKTLKSMKKCFRR